MSAELAALVRMNGVISVSKQEFTLDVHTENAAIARRIYTLIKLLFELDILHDNYTFIRTISKKYSNKTCCRRAYLRGAFLAGGSINNPETSSYHLEIFNTHQEHNAGLHELLNDFDLRARELER